jgi:hypothetical protein
MRKLLLLAWLLLPVAGAAYHYGPGQDHLADDRTATLVESAQSLAARARAVAALEGDAAAKGLWIEADAAYSEALSSVRNEHVALARTLQLERAKAQMFASKLPEARRDLEQLVGELSSDPQADPQQVVQAREALANAQYYNTWLMRLEGAPRDEWEREIDASRQNYKLLAEKAEQAQDDETAKKIKESLESAIALARMDLTELQGLPLPSQ